MKQEHDNNHNNNNHKDYDKWNTFCGTGYAVVTAYENLRRNVDVYISNHWSYVVLDGTHIHIIYISWNRQYIVISFITHIFPTMSILYCYICVNFLSLLKVWLRIEALQATLLPSLMQTLVQLASTSTEDDDEDDTNNTIDNEDE